MKKIFCKVWKERYFWRFARKHSFLYRRDNYSVLTIYSAPWAGIFSPLVILVSLLIFLKLILSLYVVTAKECD